MKRTREQIKAELMKRYEKEVEELLDWQEKTEAPNLTQIEDAILKSRKRLSEGMAKELLAGEISREPEQAPACPKCGGKTVDKGKRPQVIETRLGTLRMERVYYYCEACGEGFFPPG
jgi:YgiT-type zinc finger domain-containing protein